MTAIIDADFNILPLVLTCMFVYMRRSTVDP